MTETLAPLGESVLKFEFRTFVLVSNFRDDTGPQASAYGGVVGIWISDLPLYLPLPWSSPRASFANVAASVFGQFRTTMSK